MSWSVGLDDEQLHSILKYLRDWREVAAVVLLRQKLEEAYDRGYEAGFAKGRDNPES